MSFITDEKVVHLGKRGAILNNGEAVIHLSPL